MSLNPNTIKKVHLDPWLSTEPSENFDQFAWINKPISLGTSIVDLLSRNPRDSLKYFEISLLRHIRFVELRKNKSNNHISQMNMYLTPEVRDTLKILWKRGEIAPLGAISPLFHNILLPVVRFPC